LAARFWIWAHGGPDIAPIWPGYQDQKGRADRRALFTTLVGVWCVDGDSPSSVEALEEHRSALNMLLLRCAALPRGGFVLQLIHTVATGGGRKRELGWW
jgi:hypothetical protein